MEEAAVLPAEGDPLRAADDFAAMLPAQLQAGTVRHCTPKLAAVKMLSDLKMICPNGRRGAGRGGGGNCLPHMFYIE